MKKTFLLFFIAFSIKSFGQKDYPQDYFRNPLDIPIVLSGTFGELRNNHFHSGLDMKTKQRTGLKLYAVAAGYVSRVKVSLFGYGKAIYIKHPNGYTSVYAHLSQYEGVIEAFVKNQQYQKKSYETGNIYLKPNEILVQKGQIIGYTGRTGGFVSPHLHFEIRNSATEKVINPMHFGIFPRDTIPPVFNALFAYPLQNDSRIFQSNKKTNIPFKKLKDNTFRTDEISANGLIGFGVNVFDRLNNARNKNGVYSLSVEINGQEVYHHDLETFSFAESKFINLLIDYPHLATYKKRIQKLFKVAENKLNIYDKLIENGFLKIENGLNYIVKIKAKDFYGNTSSLIVPIKGVSNNVVFKEQKDTTAYKIEYEKFYRFFSNNVHVAFPKNTFYEDLYLNFEVKNGIAKIHEPKLPLNKKFTLTFDVSDFSDLEKEQLYIAYFKSKERPYYVTTTKRDSIFYTTSKTLGNYKLLADKQPPSIYDLNFKDGQWITNLSFLKVKINDEDSGISSYYATIDDEWILMEYDLQKKQLIYDFNDKKLVGSKHAFKIVVEDNVGNTNTITKTFYKKQ